MTTTKGLLTKGQVFVNLWYFMDEVYSAHAIERSTRDAESDGGDIKAIEGCIDQIWVRVVGSSTYPRQIEAILCAVEHMMVAHNLIPQRNRLVFAGAPRATEPEPVRRMGPYDMH